MIDGELKTVATFNDRISADITAGMLNDNGIPAAVFGAVSAYPQLGFGDPIEVKVNADDYDKAKELLDTPAPDIE